MTERLGSRPFREPGPNPARPLEPPGRGQVIESSQPRCPHLKIGKSLPPRLLGELSEILFCMGGKERILVKAVQGPCDSLSREVTLKDRATGPGVRRPEELGDAPVPGVVCRG